MSFRLLLFMLVSYSLPITAQIPESAEPGLETIVAQEEKYVEWLTNIGGIISPSGKEQERAEAVATIMREIGLQQVRVNDQPNAIGLLPGKSEKKIVFVSTLDDLAGVAEHQRAAQEAPKSKGDRLIGPGTNTSSITVAMLAAADAWIRSGIQPEFTLVFAAVAQEETGLKGMQHLVDEYEQEAIAFIDILGDGQRLTYGAISIHWWKVVASGPPGHTLRVGFPDQPKVNQAIGRAVDLILQLPHPNDQPEEVTRINIGMIHSGSVYNHQPDTGFFTLDLRSLQTPIIEEMEVAVRNILEVVSQETGIQFDMQAFQITNGGQIKGFTDSEIFQHAVAVSRRLGYEPELSNAGSSNMNVPIHKGVPAIGLGGERGGRRGFADEWADIPNMLRAAQFVYLYGFFGANDR